MAKYTTDLDRAADGPLSVFGCAIVLLLLLLLELSVIGSAAQGASEKAGAPRCENLELCRVVRAAGF